MKWVKRRPKVTPKENDSVLEKIAKIRGIDDIQRFLNPTQDELHDPYLMKNIEKAANRIIQAIKNNERICLSYDADADGITATTIMYRYLKNYTDNLYYIYSERGDGHGIQNQYKQITPDTDLLIIIDSSSNEVETCKKIEEYGIDIIILDHHAVEMKNPYCILVNPQQKDCKYPNKYLSGAGVVFKTIQVMEDTLGEVDVWQYIDLVAVGMYADVMRLDVLENRFLIMHGLRNIRNTGLLRILKGAKADLYKLNGDTIGFTIAPLINGVARMDNIKLAIDILLEDDDNVCKKLRLQMQKLNEKRKERQKEIVEQYMKHIDINDTRKVIIVTDEKSSKGFNGLVAQQLSEIFRRPVIVGRIHKGELAGSFRSYNNFKFKEFLQQFDGEIEAMGHESSGGIVIKEDQIPLLEKYIEKFMPEPKDIEPTIYYDLEINADEIHEYIHDIERVNLLTGNGFPKVLVKVNGITIEEPECIGKTRETIKIKTFDNVELIKFKVDENYASELGYFDVIDVVGELNINEFYHFGLKQKISTPQIRIEDYRVA